MKATVIYARYSSEKQTEQSIEIQYNRDIPKNKKIKTEQCVKGGRNL